MNSNGELRGTKRGREEEEEPEGQPVQKAATPHPPSVSLHKTRTRASISVN